MLECVRVCLRPATLCFLTWDQRCRWPSLTRLCGGFEHESSHNHGLSVRIAKHVFTHGYIMGVGAHVNKQSVQCHAKRMNIFWEYWLIWHQHTHHLYHQDESSKSPCFHKSIIKVLNTQKGFLFPLYECFCSLVTNKRELFAHFFHETAAATLTGQCLDSCLPGIILCQWSSAAVGLPYYKCTLTTATWMVEVDRVGGSGMY